MLASSIFIDGNALLALATRDTLLPVLAVLKLAESLPLSELYKGLPSRVTFSVRLKDIERRVSNSIIENGTLNPRKLVEELNLGFLHLDSHDETDGLRLIFSNKDVVHLKPYGNAPELRCYTESTTLTKAKQLCEITLSSISSRII